MENCKQTAVNLLKNWKREQYIFGNGVLSQLGETVSKYGRNVLLVSNGGHSAAFLNDVIADLEKQGVHVICGCAVKGAKPNTPREDVYRIESYILHFLPDCVVAIGGGSTIDACKAAIVLATYGKEVTPEIDGYFGTGKVTEAAEKTGIPMIPLIAVQTAASSGAHLTKYSNITDPVSGQKLLIVDPAVVPRQSFFDYSVTASMPLRTTLDGALDGIAHTFEAFCGAKEDNYELLKTIAMTAIELILKYTGKIIQNPSDEEAREALGLATDLGGYAIMVGGTSGAHLTSFSLVNLIAHGTACGIMNPYYTVFYAPKIQRQLSEVGALLQQYGYISQDIRNLKEREKAEAVAKGFLAFSKAIGAPCTLSEIPGFSEATVQKILQAAKDPSLSMKLKNMPVSMTAADVDGYMEPVIRAAETGDLSLIRNMTEE